MNWGGADAVAALERALELDPKLATAYNNLGVVQIQLGQAEEALASFDRAIRLQPSLTIALINRGEALQLPGRYEEAAEVYRQVLEIEPQNAWVHTFLGHVLLEGGDIDVVDEAEMHCRKATALEPRMAIAHNNLGNVLYAMERFEEALASYHRAIELDPSLALPWNNIGRIEQRCGRYDAAHAAYAQALVRDPRSARVHANLASLLADQERKEEALERYQIALECEPGCTEAITGIASLMLGLGRRAQARAALEQCMQLRPRAQAARMGMAQIMAEDGVFEQSSCYARQVLADFPAEADAYCLLARNLRDRLPDDDLEAMIALLDRPHRGSSWIATLAFAIATALDAKGRYEEAARYFELGNARHAAVLARQGRSFDADQFSRTIDGIISSFTPQFFKSVSGRGNPSRRPVFVVGMPRSGTTLTEQILASHPSIAGAGELEDVGQLVSRLSALSAERRSVAQTLLDLDERAFHDVAEEQVVRLEQLAGGALHVVDKMPSNYLHLGVIAALWPKATIIVCRRDPRDVAISCWTTHFGAIHWSNDLNTITRQIIDHDRLIAHWKAVVPVPLIEVVYEHTVGDCEFQARRLLEAVGVSWDPACLEFHGLKRPVRTASLNQVRKPIYATSVNRWKHYERALAPFMESVARSSCSAQTSTSQPELFRDRVSSLGLGPRGVDTDRMRCSSPNPVSALVLKQ